MVQQSLPVDDNDLNIDVDEDELALLDQLEGEENNGGSDENRPYRPETLEDLGNMTVWQHVEFWWEIISGFYINLTSSSIGQISDNLDLCYGNATVVYNDGFGVYK